jgi:hypothetical protein
MDKIWIWFLTIVIILVISIFGLNYLANVKLKEFYNSYYEAACKEQEPNTLCSQTGGCYTSCGSACPPKQKLPVLKTFDFFKETSCISVCVPQCVCKYGYEFNKEAGCIKG